jgi:tetratricopeptide (TPR) repeat protein
LTIIYRQLRVSCGLSATVNATQPQELKISPSETFGHWLDAQWLRLTNNEDRNNPLVDLCPGREFQWVAVLDYILLRKIRSSFLLCKGINPGAFTTEVAYEDLNWATLTPIFTKIISKLNEMKEDWPIWHYEGELKEPENNLHTDKYRKASLELIQQIKFFYCTFQTNFTVGFEAEWKQAIQNVLDFPERVTSRSVVAHLDYYKTDFELEGLLNTLGYIKDSSSGSAYPKSVAPNAIILINRPGHWVTEDNFFNARGTILDSLTAGTDVIRSGDTFNYFKPVDNLRLMKKTLPDLAKIFPNVEIKLEDEDLTEFPPLELPETKTPGVVATDYHEKAANEYAVGEYKKALNHKRVECALLEKTGNKGLYYDNLVEFTDWCLNHDKPLTAEANFTALNTLEPSLNTDHLSYIIKHHQLLARYFTISGEHKKAIEQINLALEICSDNECETQSFDLANSLGVAYARMENYPEALKGFNKARKFAFISLEKFADEMAEDPKGPAKRYWPAIVKGIQNKIDEITKIMNTKPKPVENAGTAKKVE